MRKKSYAKTFPDRAVDVAYNSQYLYDRIDDSAGPQACWRYTGAHHKQGYGMIGGYRLATEKKIMQTVHRLLYKITHNTDPGTMDVIHTCGNMWCCNPNHLILGDAKQIADLRTQRGVTSTGKPYGWKAKGPRAQTYRHGLDNIIAVYHQGRTDEEFAQHAGIDLARARKICADIRLGRIYTWLKDYKEPK